MYPNVHSSIIYNGQDMEATYVSIMYVYAYMDTYTHIVLNHKKEWSFSICKNMEDFPGGSDGMHLEGITLSGKNTNKKRQIPHDITCMWILKSKTS